jgi:hypothetical protein
MHYWVGVVGSRETVERLRTETETWWCAPKEATAGDLIALYVARSKLKDLPENQAGIVAIFEILGADAEREMDCRGFGGGMGGQILAPIRIVAKEKFAVSLKLADMRQDIRLSASQFVSRSFQGTCFAASAEEFQRIVKLLARKQP